ncbi:MAG: hypothetical protein V4445_06990 [Pseudomonadota bacterium]
MSLSTLTIQTAYMPLAAAVQQPWQTSALGAVCFVDTATGSQIECQLKLPMLLLRAPVLAGAEAACEVWLSHTSKPLGATQLNVGQKGAIQYRSNDDYLFGLITLDESAILPHDSAIAPLQQAAESAYRQIFALMDTQGYPYMYRFWNYMADINGVSHGLERYRQFNVGRKNAFLACGREVAEQLPAACALGLVDGALTIAFLVGRQAPVAIENPRQVSAYEYPAEYGPRTPSFSRATLLCAEQDALLFISGTASIVGHQTLHPQDVLAQTRETIANLEAVIAEANRVLGQHNFNLQRMFFRVYLRHAADLAVVQNAMQHHIGGKLNVVFVQADICRQELLLEIEATAAPVLERVCT